jgi:hypothetical protein
MTLPDRINAQLATLDLLPLTSEQVACLTDPNRIEEAAGMLDDLHARCGVRLPLPQGTDVGPVFDNEEEARDEAREQANRFDAVCVEEMATDDGRSFGINEFRLVAFTGPDAALAAACHPGVVAYWVDGQQH